MIIIKIKGGLGNQMFQYAFGRSLSLKLNTELKLDLSKETDPKGIKKDIERAFGLKHFNIKAETASRADVLKLRKPLSLYFSKLKRKLFKYDYYHFDPSFLQSKDGSYFEGYWWQSELYFKDIRETLIKDFTLTESFGTEASKIAESIRQTETPVSLHVRRGDYANDPATRSYHGLASLEYYRSAIETIKEKASHPVFFIFSDDIEWVKANLTLPPLSFFVSDKSIPDYEELALMSLCRHHIIANSSFSWWGAWLSQSEDKTIIAPRRWISSNTGKSDDIYPSAWIKL